MSDVTVKIALPSASWISTAGYRTARDRNASQLVQASQDVLTLLSQDGIYMDDLCLLYTSPSPRDS